MKHKRPPIPVIVILVLAVLVGGYFGIRALLNPASNVLAASGTIEAVEVSIAPEIGGKVAEVAVDQGAAVKAGDMLFRLDDTLLQAQRAVAAASLETAKASTTSAAAALAAAQANYTLSLNAARLASAATRTTEWSASFPSGYTLPGGYFSQAEEIGAAQVEVDNAGAASLAAQDTLNGLLADAAAAPFVEAEKRLANARAACLAAQDVLGRANFGNNYDLQVAAQSASDAAQTELDNAQAGYDGLRYSATAWNIITARANLSAAQERLESARDRLLALQTGENSPQVAAAQAALHQAQAFADQAALAAAQSEASLGLVDAQIARLTVTSPADGTILTRSIQPGEVIAPSATAMTLGRLEKLTITVYVPENLYGELSLGQSASMTVDSFPAETFTATVISIADQAEFTPRNVQTVEGRSSTVFAIKLQVQDTNGRLKPGMAGDVSFTLAR
jgi:HlyD family secretion protein